MFNFINHKSWQNQEKAELFRQLDQKANSMYISRRFLHIVSVIYIALMGINFAIAENSPFWDFIYFAINALLPIFLILRLQVFEKTITNKLLICLYLSIFLFILAKYLFNATQSGFNTYIYFLLTLVLLTVINYNER